MNTETVWTNEELELLYRQCRNCANRYRRAFSLAEDDALDAASNAYLAALKYLPRLVPVRRDQALKALARSKVVDQLRQRNLLANRMFATAYRLDAAGGDDHSASSPPPLIGDGGRQARALSALDDGPEPEWVYGVRERCRKLHGIERRIANALKQTWFYDVVRARLHLPKRRFWHFLKNLRRRFAQCLSAYNAYRAQTGRD